MSEIKKQVTSKKKQKKKKILKTVDEHILTLTVAFPARERDLLLKLMASKLPVYERNLRISSMHMSALWFLVFNDFVYETDIFPFMSRNFSNI